jgi:hypothetical protein
MIDGRGMVGTIRHRKSALEAMQSALLPGPTIGHRIMLMSIPNLQR